MYKSLDVKAFFFLLINPTCPKIMLTGAASQ